ncbi:MULTISPECIES: Holliday junction branch migration DNA helicase RuvB [Allobaculum]|uniref:Holliday junction branch migration DNA helicase RuvB n=1 Tax=Allobaculum TaxID=174708 RepID=UPI001E2C873A|nr:MULTISPECIES: Holliday junction branch migration DNA helicase RuvB [Allobaculum]UNT94233.1 Holliday junction branch migration DNA helicase RuvB [Allobaculum sp. Allo2]
MEEERLVDAAEQTEDKDQALRPATLAEYIGQQELKQNLNVYIQAARSRSEVLDHVLLYGPPGLGKTTLAMIIAHEMNGNLVTASGPAIQKSGDLAAILSTLEAGDVLFIDEIHRIPRQIEEILYSAMEDFYLDIVVGKEGASAHSIRLALPPFTLVGATTRAGDLSAPLRDRFGIVLPLEYYAQADLEKIVSRTSGILNTSIEDDAIGEVARRSRGTPRIANRLLRRIRDFAQVYNGGHISLDVAGDALDRMKVDDLGLDQVDRKYLEGIIFRFGGGPVGVEALASSIGEDAATLEDMYEPFLLQTGLINRTPRGRIATPKAYAHLHITESALHDEAEDDSQD